MRDFRWEHLVASALTPMGQGGLADYTPTVALPTLAQMIDWLVAAGFSKCNIADGEESHLGAWSMDCIWHALQVWHGMAKRKTKGCWVGNEVYFSAASRMAADCQAELSHWTRKLGGGG